MHVWKRISPVFMICGLLVFVAFANADTRDQKGERDADVHSEAVFGANQKEIEEVASTYSVSEADAERYLDLMKIERHFTADTLTPWEVLGKHARSEAERDKWAQVFFERVEQDAIGGMAFAVRVKELGERQWNQKNVIAESAAIRNFLGQWDLPSPDVDVSRSDEYTGQRIRMFVDVERCKSKCGELFRDLMLRHSGGAISGVDITLMGQGIFRPKNDQINQFAASVGLDEGHINSGAVTLTYEGENAKLTIAGRGLPLALDERDVIVRPGQ